MRLFSKRSRESGFTLIEVMAALVVFSLITMGIIPVLAASMRAATLSRSYTVGKNATLKAMERVRGLPYFISYVAQAKRVDVLDFYYPGTANSPPNQTYTSAPQYKYTTICAAGSALPACPDEIPDDYTITFEAQFVRAEESGGTTTYEPLPPVAGYTWNSVGNGDLPAGQLALIRVTSDWTAAGRDRSYSLTSLISDRKFGDVSVQGNAEVTYAIQALTSFKQSGGDSELVAKVGRSESNVLTRTASSATQTAGGGDIRLIRTSSDPLVAASSIGEVNGVSVAYDAPPNQTPLGSTAGAGSIVHPDISGTPLVAGMGGTTAQGPAPGLQVGVSNELPVARGGMNFNAALAQEDLWINTETDFVSMQLNPAKHVLSVRPRTIGNEVGASASTYAETFGLGTAGRGVAARATVSVNQLELLPTSFIPTGPRSVLYIQNFTATADCKATANSVTAVASPTWSANLWYWQDADAGDKNTNVGSYQLLSLNGNGANTLGAYGPAPLTNPVVYDGTAGNNDDDIFLFKGTGKRGYLTDWSSLYNATATSFRKDANGQSVSANMGGVLRINTAQTDKNAAHATMQLALGSLNCSAVDKR